MKHNTLKAVSITLAAAAALSCTACSGSEESEGFQPKLDADKTVTIDVAGFFGNFEALDQVENDFNEYYPNVQFTYEQITGTNTDDYLDNNPHIDVFMTKDENIRFPGMTDKYCADRCADLTDVVSTPAFQDGMLDICRVDGKLLRVPMSQNLCGIVVNVSLLEKEGLSVPETYDEFTAVLSALKEKGYTPIQGPVESVYSELFANMAYSIIGGDSELQSALYAGDDSASEKLLPVFERLSDIVDNGWTDMAVNETYPQDNYDQAILRFFEGDVPFWVCNTEKVGGMRKRESKSEAFTASPFEYRFMFAPVGDNGAYEYREPWFGFSVNRDSDVLDYSKEFIRFLATSPELNKIAEIKGVPSAANGSEDERYADVASVSRVEKTYINDGAIKPHIVSFFNDAAKKYASGEVSTPEEAALEFISRCSTVSEED